MENVLRIYSLFAVLSLCASIPLNAIAQPADRPLWTIGDSWTYATTSYPTSQNLAMTRFEFTFSVTGMNKRAYAFVRKYLDAKGHEETDPVKHWSRNLNYYVQDYEGKWHEVDRFRWPLQEGSAWRVPLVTANADAHEIQMSVGNWESVTVPAGRFRAVKVRYWLPTISNGWSVEDERIWWYAPEAKNYVRFEEKRYARGWLLKNVVEELSSYTLKN